MNKTIEGGTRPRKGKAHKLKAYRKASLRFGGNHSRSWRSMSSSHPWRGERGTIFLLLANILKNLTYRKGFP